jgi:YtkA-like
VKLQLRLVLPVLAVLLVGGFATWHLWSGSSNTAAAGSQANAGPYVVRLSTDSVPRGVAELALDITGGGNEPVAPDNVSVEPVMTQMSHALRPVRATPSAPGTYRAQVDFEMSGQWDITVRITSGNETHEAVLSVTVVN